MFFLVFLLFIVSEGLLFVSFFWTSFHSLSSPTLGIWPGEGFYLPDPCELTFANTLLLSNAAISLGNAFISLEISSQFLLFFSLFSLVLAWTFIVMEIILVRQPKIPEDNKNVGFANVIQTCLSIVTVIICSTRSKP